MAWLDDFRGKPVTAVRVGFGLHSRHRLGPWVHDAGTAVTLIASHRSVPSPGLSQPWRIPGIVVVDAAPGDWQKGGCLLGGPRELALLDACQTAPSALAR
jgi:hypothetical protein